jgi:hypothetical protein
MRTVTITTHRSWPGRGGNERVITRRADTDDTNARLGDIATTPGHRKCSDEGGALLPHTGNSSAERTMRKINSLSFGTIKSCAGRNRPFAVRKGWSEALVGYDGRLYCYGRTCEADAMRGHSAETKARKAA